MCDGRVIFDPDAHETCSAQECTDISDILASWPVTDAGYFGVIWDVAFVVTLVAKDHNFWDCNKQLFSRNSGASTAEAMEDTVDINKVLPDEGADARIVRNGVIAAVAGFIMCGRPFDAAVVHVGPGDMRDFWFKDKGDIFVKYCPSVGPTLRQAGESDGANG